MNEIAIIAGMAVATFITRYPMLLLVSKIELPEKIKSAFKFVPIAVLSAIIAPLIFLQNGQPAISLENPFLLAGIVSILVAWRSSNLLLTILLGMASLWLFQAII